MAYELEAIDAESGRNISPPTPPRASSPPRAATPPSTAPPPPYFCRHHNPSDRPNIHTRIVFILCALLVLGPIAAFLYRCITRTPTDKRDHPWELTVYMGTSISAALSIAGMLCNWLIPNNMALYRYYPLGLVGLGAWASFIGCYVKHIDWDGWAENLNGRR